MQVPKYKIGDQFKAPNAKYDVLYEINYVEAAIDRVHYRISVDNDFDTYTTEDKLDLMTKIN